MKKLIDQSNFDKSIKPTDDFYQYVNGGWMKKNPIPKSECRWSLFDILIKENYKRLRIITKKIVVGKHKRGSEKQKVKDFWLTAMNQKKRNNHGIKPLLSYFHLIDNIKNVNDLVVVVALLHRIGIGGLWDFFVEVDDKNTEVMCLQFSQAGTSLPEKEYYTSGSKDMRKIRKEFIKHIKRTFTLLNDKKPLRSAKLVLKIEKLLASAQLSEEEMRDPNRLYNKKTFREFQRLTPDISWEKYFMAAKIPLVKYVIVLQPKFFERVNSLLKEININDWKTYLKWHLISDTSYDLSDDFVKENFSFYGRVLNGSEKMHHRWEKCLSSLEESLGDVLGKEYVKYYFPKKAKERINKLIDNLIKVYIKRIKALDWMSEQTKFRAIRKIEKVSRKVGYPKNWDDYSALVIKTDSHILNVLRANEFGVQNSLDKLNKPVDHKEWEDLPQTVNAFYNPLFNEIVFPAGILQFPFFDFEADDAFNYGGIGSVIGHELTHALDDAGAEFNEDGNLKNWWFEEDKKKFKAKGRKIIKQFERHEILDRKINGKLTLGENIADLGGLAIAFDAFRSLSRGGDNQTLIDGFTSEQRFFISYAQTEACNNRSEYLKKCLVEDPHSPSKQRVNEPLQNMDEFHEIFGVTPKDKMYRKKSERVKIW